MKHHRHPLLLLLLVCFAALPSLAQPKSFVVTLLNGESVMYNLSDRPVLTFTDGTMKIKTAKMESVFELPEIAGSEFSEEAGVDIVADDSKTTVFDFTSSPDHIIVTGAQRADVFDISGKLVMRCKTSHDKRIDIDTSSLAVGVYVIYTSARSIKYAKQ